MGSSWHCTCIKLSVNLADPVKYDNVCEAEFVSIHCYKNRVTDLVIFNSVDQTQQCES